MQYPEFYTEGCNFIRHYSSASLTVRLGTLIQGLALLSSWGYTYFKTPPSNPLLLILISSFGILFTTLLFLMHKGYLLAADEYTSIIENIEKIEKINNVGPVSGYEEKRRKIYKSIIVRYITVHSTFSLVGLAFFLLLIYSVYLAL